MDKGEKLILVTPKRSAPPRKGEVRVHLEGKGYRLTPQREAVYDYLRRVHHHPTAEDVYLAVKGRLPRVSLTTVYNALELLVRSGLASRFIYGNASTRYDIRTDVHSHVRCLHCGRVEDLDVVPDERWLRQVRAPGFDATGFRFEVVGRCAACRKGA
jgi:Fe2+ or Zn2+ uptake regulation protein